MSSLVGEIAIPHSSRDYLWEQICRTARVADVYRRPNGVTRAHAPRGAEDNHDATGFVTLGDITCGLSVRAGGGVKAFKWHL